ncbi:MAG: hypothetical protein KBB11_00070 [Bacteroidales bacterium]|nr:hypothetical protein [Bacteroidales bacterium]HOY39732.1 hypothetical protein [Bacteroidales bacterium]HQP03910.1 hypothetical protein [Bacteroidales bacterium]
MLAEILTITIPPLLVLLTAYLVIDKMLKRDAENRKLEVSLKNQSIITPIRLQAYERVVLLLERISPNHLVMRIQQPGMTVNELQREMLVNIRAEFEHNLSQQLYLRPETWDIVKIAKENTIKLINTCAAGLDPSDEAMVLTKSIFDKLIELTKAPNQVALDTIKKEINELF